MGERQITVDGVSRSLPRPFLVLATQNPIEYEGTFPLPEAQLDRFLLRLRLGYPSLEDERVILENLRRRHPIDTLDRVAGADELLALHDVVADVYVDLSIRDYILDIIRATRVHPDVALGASPRGSLALFKTAQAYAAIQGRDYVLPDDVKRLAPFALAHRIIVRPESQLRGRAADDVLQSVIHGIEVPVTSR